MNEARRSAHSEMKTTMSVAMNSDDIDDYVVHNDTSATLTDLTLS